MSTEADAESTPLIQGNSIKLSKLNGIFCAGVRTSPVIKENMIDNNRKAGIKISEEAHAEICEQNKINKNYTQGILIVEGSSARICENHITRNTEANIAFGGKGSGKTLIEKNVISGSIAEGVFLVEGEEHATIVHNTIHENKDGVVLYNSQGQVLQNDVRGNQRTGVQTAGQTSALISGNKVKDNISIGLMVKEPSNPELRGNNIRGNHY